VTMLRTWGGNPAFDELAQAVRGERSVLGGFEYDRVAGRKSRCDLLEGDEAS
jgi:hypothetical protein